jgi:hypothetical protein
MSNKSEEMEEMLDFVSKQFFGRSRKDNVCVTCGSDKVAKPEHFKDDVSWEEWKISRMCQQCQDEIWGGDE